MSTRVSRCAPWSCVGTSSQQKKMVLDVDLNVPLSDYSNFNEVGASTSAPAVPAMRGEQQRLEPPAVTIDVDTIDDDVVVLSSPRAFAEARNNSRWRQSRSNVIDVELESANIDAANNCNKRRRLPPNQLIIDCESYTKRNNISVNVHVRNKAARIRHFLAPPSPPPPPPPPPEPILNCPICMGHFAEEVSTKCGHIFCNACIRKALAVRSTCPTCRKKVTSRGLIRIYLPKAS